MSFVDRANIGNAKIAGMETDLNLQGMQYNVAVTTFFVSYGLLEVPSNIVLKLMRPSRWIAILLFSVCLSELSFNTTANSSAVGRGDDAHGTCELL
jgi:hypothetical protein